MKTNRPDVIEVLEREKEYYLDQIKRINIALSALRGESIETKTDTTPTRKIEWTAEIVKLFDEYDELNLKQVREKLSEKGITEALDEKYRSTINTTLNRKAKDGILFKTENGGYRKRHEKPENFYDASEKQSVLVSQK